MAAVPPPEGSFVELMVRHQRAIYGYLYTLVHNQADADDLLQQTSLVLWQKFADFQPGTNFVAWACRTAHLEALNFLKSSRRSQVILSNDVLNLLAESRLDREELHSQQRLALDHCLQRLSAADRRLVELCYGGEFNFKEAAAQLQRPVNSVYVRLSHIRQALHRCIQTQLAAEERS